MLALLGRMTHVARLFYFAPLIREENNKKKNNLRVPAKRACSPSGLAHATKTRKLRKRRSTLTTATHAVTVLVCAVSAKIVGTYDARKYYCPDAPGPASWYCNSGAVISWIPHLRRK